VLIGAHLYGSLLLDDLRQGPLGTPTAQNTALDWIISGPTEVARSNLEGDLAQVSHCVSDDDTNSLLWRFWEDEEVSQLWSLKEDAQYEQHFISTHSRKADGRYVVRLPFKAGGTVDLGDSLPTATALSARMESRLRPRLEMREQYSDFLREYRELSHMELASPERVPRFKPVYIPHHAVIREASSTTKLRVVFNASCKTHDDTSLNDHLLIGPKLQQDLPAIIARWRQWRYVYAADIEKMFRQIWVDPADADFQRILWRPTSESPIQHYRLLTVTYGLVSALYLAARVLKQLAIDDGRSFPAAVSIVENSTYVDDTLFGGDDIPDLRETRDQLIALMGGGYFGCGSGPRIQ